MAKVLIDEGKRYLEVVCPFYKSKIYKEVNKGRKDLHQSNIEMAAVYPQFVPLLKIIPTWALRLVQTGLGEKTVYPWIEEV